MSACPHCGHPVLDIDVKCATCGAPLGSTGAHQLVGVVVLGQYEIVDVLGQGGMSVVYRARHRITHQEVALKLLPPELAAHSQVKSRFLEEARALAQLDHPNIVHLYNFGQENGAFVLAMQYVQGETWERMILTRGRQEWPVAVRIAIDVLRALEYAHGRGIIHRDMKPSNVLVRASDGAATVMDFGIAKMTTSTRLTATGQTMGTVRYMSPEQVRGQEVDLRTDIYSLGATLYEAVLGDTPFDGNTHFEIMTKHLHEPPRPPSALGLELPPALETIVMRALQKPLEERFQTAREMRKALEEVLKDADLAIAETQRMMRDSLAPQVAPPLGGAPFPPGHPTAPLGPARPLEPVPAPAPPAASATGLADRLEPGSGAAETPARRRGRTWLWLGLTAIVLAAGAAVAVMMLRGGDEAGAARSRTRDAAAAAAPARGPEPFLPPDLPILASQEGEGVRVHVATDWQPSEVLHVWGAVRGRLERLAAERQLAIKVPAPLTIVVVPTRVFCDPRTYENGRVPAACNALGQYYRPEEQTLLIGDDRTSLPINLGVGLATAVCVHQADGSCDLVDPFEALLRKGL